MAASAVIVVNQEDGRLLQGSPSPGRRERPPAEAPAAHPGRVVTVLLDASRPKRGPPWICQRIASYPAPLCSRPGGEGRRGQQLRVSPGCECATDRCLS